MEDVLLTKVPCSTQEFISQPDINNSYEVYLLKHKLKQELDSQLEKYISVLNHDIKTPALAQIRALEHLLADSNGKLEPNQRNLLQMTLESCHEQYDIINNLINTFKYKKQEIQLECKTFNMVEMLKTTLKSLKTTVRDNNNHIKFDSSTQEIIINADEEKISDALYKLFKHILKRSIHGSTISISTTESEQNINIDIGEVIPSNNYGIAYTGSRNYYLSSENYNSVGSNLELRLAEEVIKAHNGQFRQSLTGNIQSFEIELPKKHIEY